MNYERENVRRMVGYVYGEQPARPERRQTQHQRESLSAIAGGARSDERFRRRLPAPLSAGDGGAVASAGGGTARSVGRAGGRHQRRGRGGFASPSPPSSTPGATLGVAVPGYSLSPVLAKVQDCAMVAVPLAPDWPLPADFAKRLNAAGAEAGLRGQSPCPVGHPGRLGDRLGAGRRTRRRPVGGRGLRGLRRSGTRPRPDAAVVGPRQRAPVAYAFQELFPGRTARRLPSPRFSPGRFSASKELMVSRS